MSELFKDAPLSYVVADPVVQPPLSSGHHLTNISAEGHVTRLTLKFEDKDDEDGFIIGELPFKEPSVYISLIHFARESWLNVLFIFLPISWGLHYAPAHHLEAEFATALLGIVPLSRTLGYISEQLALRCEPKFGMMIIISMGNVIEFIIATILLVSCDLQVVQSSLVGAILSNLLLVLGGSFFAGGIRYSQQGFASVAAKLSASILLVSVIAVLIPAGFDAALTYATSWELEAQLVVQMSRIIAIMLLVTYTAYLFFQLITHSHLYHAVRSAGPISTPPTIEAEDDLESPTSATLTTSNPTRLSKFVHKVAARPDGLSAGVREDLVIHEVEEVEVNLWVSLVIGAITMGLLCMSAYFFITLIDEISTVHPTLKKQWIGLILIPMISNGSEQLSSLGAAAKDKIDFAMSISIGKSVQLALFVIPLLVMIGWGTDKSLTLLFNPFISIVLFLAVLITTYTIQGKSTWFDGWLLLISWIIIAVAFWYFPADADSEISKWFACDEGDTGTADAVNATLTDAAATATETLADAAATTVELARRMLQFAY